jgi:hypothetical protein
MPIFLERFVLPALAAIMIGVLLINPLKLDRSQQISLGICVLAFAFFVGHTLHKSKSPTVALPPLIVQEASPSERDRSQAGAPSTSGSDSPAVTGNGNTFNYQQSPAKQQKPMAARKSKP